MKLADKLNARREDVLDSYKSAKSSNRRQYMDGNDRATAEYIYPNQMEDAHDIVDQFYRNNKRVVSVMKKTKVGADGLMIEKKKNKNKNFAALYDDSSMKKLHF